MKVRLWGTRGSVPRAGPDTVRYGGDTSSVEVRSDGALLVLDAGSGIGRLGSDEPWPERIDVLISHLHMDHIQGLGFFGPLFDPEVMVHLWGPVSPTMQLSARIRRYLSPPLFPVRLRDLPAVDVHDVETGRFRVGPFEVEADLICHPGPTLGYRISDGNGTLAYLSDHEPALGVRDFPDAPEWTSGHDLAAGADVLIHDTQYTPEEYRHRVGWGHSSLDHTLAFAGQAEVKRLVTFHHDPDHADPFLDDLHHVAVRQDLSFELIPGAADTVIEV